MLIRNQNLMFADFDGGAGGGDGGEQVEPQGQQPEPQGGDNPSWADIQALVDPETFARIKPKLAEWDQGVQTRLSTVTEKYKPYETLLNGRQPEYLQQAVALADQLDKSPQEVHERLGQYLQSRGISPAQAQALAQDHQQQQAQGQQQGQEEQESEDPRIAALAQQQAVILGQMQQQQRAETFRQAQVSLDNEVRQLRETHKDLDDNDIKEVIQRAALAAQRTAGTPGARVPTLEEAYQEYSALTNRILTKPRPGDSAPQLVPPAGGAASSTDQKSWGSLSKAEMQDAVAALLDQSK